MSALGIIFSHIHDDNIPELSRNRTMASVPFGGRYRLVDFALSNLVNSGVTKVGIITKNNYQSLLDHLGSGKDWDLARKDGGIILLPPYHESKENSYDTRLEALKGVTGFLSKCTDDYVILLDCDGVYRLDFTQVIAYHEAKQADITMIYHNAPVVKTPYFMSLTLDENERVTDLAVNPKIKGNANIYLNMMVINRQLLLNLILDSITHNYTSFGRDVLPRSLRSMNIVGYNFEGFHCAMTSMQAYYENNMKLLDKNVRKELFGERDIYTKVRDSAPSKYGNDAIVKNSLVSDGCVIEGVVINSVLARGVKVGKGTVIKDSIIMQDGVIGENCNLTCLIADKNVVIRDNRTLAGCDVQPYFIAKGSMI